MSLVFDDEGNAVRPWLLCRCCSEKARQPELQSLPASSFVGKHVKCPFVPDEADAAMVPIEYMWVHVASADDVTGEMAGYLISQPVLWHDGLESADPVAFTKADIEAAVFDPCGCERRWLRIARSRLRRLQPRRAARNKGPAPV